MPSKLEDLVSCAPHGARVSSSVPDFEQRLSNLQAQMDRLRPTSGGEYSPAEQQLALLTDQCAEIVRRWAVTSERHARAVSRFETHLTEWNEAGTRLQEDASQRIKEMEKVIQQEWGELRDLQEGPVRQLHEHATSLTQVCIATATAAQQNFERSEARLAAIEHEFNRRMSELTREIQAVVAELRALHQAPAGHHLAAAAAWPLEGVTRLHNQLRQTDAAVPAIDTSAPAAALQRPVAGLLPEAAAFSDRLDSLERVLDERETRIREATLQTERVTRNWRVAIAVLALVVVGAALLGWQLRSDARSAAARADEARREAKAATDTAAREVAATRDAASAAIKTATDNAARAQIVGDILAAPDHIRYTLVGGESLPGASAQVHWSRSHGVAFSGLRIAAPPANTTYQVWLLTRGRPVAAMPFTPDVTGAATAAIQPPQVPRAVIGAMVTLEPDGGNEIPSGSAVLARPPEPAVPPANP
jgi:anti-sigma-K factor RskA